MPLYKLVDYGYPTTGELARLILNYTNSKYEDQQLADPESIGEAEKESPFATLPVLYVDGEIIAQTQGICRYLAAEHDLTGKDKKEAAMCDMVMEGLGKMFARLRTSEFQKMSPSEQTATIKEVIEKDVPQYLDRYETFLKKRTSGFFVGDKLTWCDFGVALTFTALSSRHESLLDNYTNIRDHIKRMTDIPAVGEFVKSRQENWKPSN